jgi:hypothetical protein
VKDARHRKINTALYNSYVESKKVDLIEPESRKAVTRGLLEGRL